MRRFIFIMSFLHSLSTQAFTLSGNQLKDVQRIAQAIHLLQPGLSESKYMEYAVGVYKASRRYKIEPQLLVAIAHTETAFREDLPEGKAGELGICQILKGWKENKKFIAEFGYKKDRDFVKPENSFLFAAWILSDLKQSRRGKSIPYWSYYNAVSFEPRLRYFLVVNKRLSKLQNKEVFTGAISEEPLMPLRADAIREPATYRKPVAPMKREAHGGWIANALKKLQEEQRKNPYSPAAASLVNVGRELNVGATPVVPPVMD